MHRLENGFVTTLNSLYSKEELKIIEDWFLTQKRLTSFRINTLIPQSNEVREILAKNDIAIIENPWLEKSYRLTKLEDEKKLWSLDLIKRGLIYIQGISSQIPVQSLHIADWMNVLDLAAAPGGKTSQIADRLHNTGKIIALDNNQIRMDKLDFTLKRQWVKNTQTLKIDARSYSEAHQSELFDVLLFDAPCSAEWRINLENEKSYSFISEANNKKYYKLQKEILRKNISLLKDEWQLVYSTCTLSPIENESIVHFLLCNYPELEIVDIDPEIFWELVIKPGITHTWNTAFKKEVSQSIRILPSEKTEWFFIAKFLKKSL